jgi:hypothetical protein
MAETQSNAASPVLRSERGSTEERRRLTHDNEDAADSAWRTSKSDLDADATYSAAWSAHVGWPSPTTAVLSCLLLAMIGVHLASIVHQQQPGTDTSTRVHAAVDSAPQRPLSRGAGGASARRARTHRISAPATGVHDTRLKSSAWRCDGASAEWHEVLDAAGGAFGAGKRARVFRAADLDADLVRTALAGKWVVLIGDSVSEPHDASHMMRAPPQPRRPHWGLGMHRRPATAAPAAHAVRTVMLTRCGSGDGACCRARTLRLM